MKQPKKQFKPVPFFESIQSYRPVPKQKISNNLYVNIRPIIQVLQDKHSANAYFITFGLGKTDLNVDQEWNQFGKTFQQLVDNLMNTFWISGILVGFEMYSKNKKRKKNTKALKPHAHMVIFTYNSFMQIPISEIEIRLNQFMSDVRIDYLKTAKDGAKASCYTVKSAKQDLVKQACKHFLNSQPCALFINHWIKYNPLHFLPKVLANQGIDYYVNHVTPNHPRLNFIPSVDRFQGDEKMQMAAFVKELCLKQGIAIYKDKLLSQNSPSKYTWFNFTDKENLITMLTENKGFPSTYKRQMYNNADWILNEGSKNATKAAPVQTIFPRLTISPHLWEFSDHQIYNFCTGKVEKKPLTPFVSCSKYHNYLWDDLPGPQRVINLISNLLGDEEKQITNFIVGLGTLFHPLQSRKLQPAVWLWGTSTTFKTAFMAKFFKNNFSEMLITYIEQSRQTQFKYGRLRGITEGILYIDEYRDQNFGEIAPLLNIADGQVLALEEKYKQSQLTKFDGHPLITSNQSIADTTYQPYDQDALRHRFMEINFRVEPDKTSQINELFEAIQPNEWVSFGVFTNIFYLCHIEKRNHDGLDIPMKWAHLPFNRQLEHRYPLEPTEKTKQTQQSQQKPERIKQKPRRNKKTENNFVRWSFNPFDRDNYLKKGIKLSKKLQK